MTEPIRVILADDYHIARLGMKTLLESQTGIVVVGEASNAAEALSKCPDLVPDILIVALEIPGDCLSLLARTQLLNLPIRVIIVCEFAAEHKEFYIAAMKGGCGGIVIKQIEPEKMLKAIREVHSGEIWLDSKMMTAVMNRFSSEAAPHTAADGRKPLSAREKEIVSHVARGLKNREISELMCISEQTVKNHLHNIFDKLGVSDRLELALYAVHKGLHLLGDPKPNQESRTAQTPIRARTGTAGD